MYQPRKVAEVPESLDKRGRHGLLQAMEERLHAID
jgi:hypothetical protein